MSLNKLLVSYEAIKARTSVHSNIDPKLIYPDIKASQDIYIEPLLGSKLFDKIQSDSNDGSITGVYKTLLDDYIVDVLMNHTLAELVLTLGYQFFNKGVIRITSDNTEVPTLEDLNIISKRFRQRAEMYANRCMLYLKEHYNLYPEYLNFGSGVDGIAPQESTFTLPMYLGSSFCPYCLGIDVATSEKRCKCRRK